MRRLTGRVTIIVLSLLVLLVVLFILLPAVFTSSLAVVYSGSMAPVMPMGAIAVMEQVDPAQIKVGDIIAFNPPWDPEVTVSHRVIEVVDDGFYTKGDANEDPDLDIVPATNVISRVSFNVPHLGYVLASVRNYSENQLGFALFICLPTILLIGSAIIDMNSMLSPRKRRARQRKKIEERRKERKLHRPNRLTVMLNFK